MTGTALLDVAGGAAVAWPAGPGGDVAGIALLDAAGGAAVAWPEGAGGGVAGIALFDAIGAVAVSGEAIDDICLIATRIFLAGVDCSGSDWILQLSIAIMGNLKQYVKT